jgi:hypothetical protein
MKKIARNLIKRWLKKDLEKQRKSEAFLAKKEVLI